MGVGLKNRALRPVFFILQPAQGILHAEPLPQRLNPTDRSRCPAYGKRWNNGKKVNFGRVKCSIA